MNRIAQSARTLIWLLPLAMLLPSCSRKQEFARSENTSGSIPMQEFIGPTSIVMTDSGRTLWVLNTVHMIREQADGITTAEPVGFDYYAGEKEPASHLTALRGTTTGKQFQSFYVEGDVLVTSKRGFKLEAQDLQWSREKDQITTDKRVRFTGEQGDVLTGTGFVSNPDLTNWRILKNVRGEFREFEKRMDGKEKP